MFRSFLKDQMKRKNLKAKDAAEKIGIPVPALSNAINNEPVEKEAVKAICEWLELPNSALFTSEDEPIFGSLDTVSSKAPDLLLVLKTAGEEVRNGGLKEEEFRGIVEYAVTRISEREAKKGKRTIE